MKYLPPEQLEHTSTQQQEFEVGDVVESQDNIVAPMKSKGIVIQKHIEDCPPDYDVYWYSSELGGVLKQDLKRCNGMENRDLCELCEYKYLCPNINDIVRCDISEFGEWRMEGELDIDTCKQRNCKHISECSLKKWLMKKV